MLMDGGCGRGINTMAHMCKDKVILLRALFLPVLGATTTVQTCFGRERGMWGTGAHTGKRHHCQDRGVGGDALGPIHPPASALRVLWQWLSGDSPALEGSSVLPH